jgi:hypothetical protein
LQNAGLAYASLAEYLDNLAFLGSGKPPPIEEQGDVMFPPCKRRRVGCMKCFESTLGASLSNHFE